MIALLNDWASAVDQWNKGQTVRDVVGFGYCGPASIGFAREQAQKFEITSPATDAARQWQGWGTALKPAHEPVCVARKPLEGTVATNVLKWGTGALNIDGCRVPGSIPEFDYFETGSKRGYDGGIKGGERTGEMREGRWPANVLHDGSQEVVDRFPIADCGYSSGEKSGADQSVFGQFGAGKFAPSYGDSGSASRFFYTAKADRAERNAGLEGMPSEPCGMMEDDNYPILTGHGKPRNTTRQNNHPTVKPVDLMAYLCRLVTPPGGVILDPFTGSGSTGIAALKEGFEFIGIEISLEYAAIAEKRIRGDNPLFSDVELKA